MTMVDSFSVIRVSIDRQPIAVRTRTYEYLISAQTDIKAATKTAN